MFTFEGSSSREVCSPQPAGSPWERTYGQEAWSPRVAHQCQCSETSSRDEVNTTSTCTYNNICTTKHMSTSRFMEPLQYHIKWKSEPKANRWHTLHVHAYSRIGTTLYTYLCTVHLPWAWTQAVAVQRGGQRSQCCVAPRSGHRCAQPLHSQQPYPSPASSWRTAGGGKWGVHIRALSSQN